LGNGSPGDLVFLDPRKLGFVLGFPVEVRGLTDLAGFEGLEGFSDFLGPLIEKILTKIRLICFLATGDWLLAIGDWLLTI
jgi:hypothetical protein